MKMTRQELVTAKSLLHDRVERSNYGVLCSARSSVPMRDLMAFHDAGWDIDNDMRYILNNDVPLYKIRRQYAARKVNGMYKELQPKLEYIGGVE